MRDFRNDLAAERKDIDSEELREVMDNLFPDRAEWWKITDLERQRQGIDAAVAGIGGQLVTIDFKFRSKLYFDFALEYEHRFPDGRKKDGWITDSKKTVDFIAYVVKPRGWFCYLLPMQQLRAAWQKHGDRWLAAYDKRASQNKGYATWNCCVPREIVLAAIEHHYYFADRLLGDRPFFFSPELAYRVENVS